MPSLPDSLLERRAFISAVFNDVPDAIVVTDTERRVILLNPAAERIFGYRPEELLGQSTRTLYESEAEYRRLGELYANQQAQDKPAPYVLEYRRRDGSLFPGETVAGVIRDEDGATAGYLGIVRDVGERLRQEESARLAHQRLEDALESLDAAFTLWDADDRLVLCNQRYVEFFPGREPLARPGVPFETMARHGVEQGDFVVPDGERENWIRERVERHRNPPAVPFEQRTRDGRWFAVSERRTRDGGIAATRTEITRRKRAELALASLAAIGSSPDLTLDRKIEALLTLGCQHFDLPIGIVSHIQGDTYTVRNVVAPGGELTSGMEFPVGDTYCSHVLVTNEPVSWRHVGFTDLREHPCYQRFGLEAYLGAPVAVAGARYGTINFSSPEPRSGEFIEADLDLVRLFALWVGHELERQQALDALNAARGDLERLATVDELTGLLNRRALLQAGRREFDRARRYRNAMCVLALDVDFFKNVNDTLGHAAGDRVLQQVARCCQGGVRSEDAVGRIGGEEFALVLIEITRDGARSVAERIRAAIEALKDTPEAPVTASIGVAEMSEEDDDFEALLARADAALYLAKERGRNRVCLA